MTSRAASVLLTAALAAGSFVAPRAATNESTGIVTAQPRAERATLSARIPRVPVVLDTSAYVGQRARIFLRYADLTPDGQAIAGVEWRADGLSSGALGSADERLLVFDGVIAAPSLEAVFDFQVFTTARALAGRAVLHPFFEVERSGQDGVRRDPLAARGAHGERLLVPVPASHLSADVPAARGAEQADEPGGVSISPTARGVRLARNVGGVRITLMPEATDNHGLHMGGSFASTVFGGAAAVVGSTSERRDEVLLNSAWPLGRGQFLVTVGQQREVLALNLASGLAHQRMTQRGGGVGYEGQLTAAWATRLNVQGYAYGTPSREMGAYAYMIDTDTTREFYTTNERVAGSQVLGLQTRGSFAPLRGTRITLGAGAERLGFDYLAGRQTERTVTTSASLAQQLPGRLALRVSEDRYAAHTLRHLAVGRGFLGNRHYVDATLQAVDGRRGMPDDFRFRLGYSFSMGTGRSTLRPGAEFSALEALLAQVSSRPSFMPYTPIARVDHTVAHQRLVIVHNDALPPATTIDAGDGTVTVPVTAESIVSITRNGVAFANSGQFSFGPDALMVHPMLMEQPPAGTTDWYVVVLSSEPGLFTDVTIEVQKGSLRVVSVTVGEPHGGEVDPGDGEPEPEPTDTTPDAFSFASKKGVDRSAHIVSDTIVVTGINAPAPISITGGEYSIDGGPYTSEPGVVANGQTVSVRVLSSAAYMTTESATLVIGGVSATFTVTTEAEPENTTPDAFSFTAQTGVARSTVFTSNAITVSGINVAVAVSITGGEYSVDGGAYTSAAGTVNDGQSVAVRQTSSAAFSTTTTATLTIGGISGDFKVTTEAADTTPDAFSFTAQTGVVRSTVFTSNTITVSGINAAAAISISGGEYSVDGDAYTSAPGTVNNGQSVTVRQTSSASFSTTTTAALTIGGVSADFDVTTEAMDTTPDAFSFTTKYNVKASTTQTSNSITVSGINAPAQIVVSGHSSSRYSINGGSWVSSAGTVNNGDTVRVQHTASGSDNGVRTTTLTIGGVSGTFRTVTEDD